MKNTLLYWCLLSFGYYTSFWYAFGIFIVHEILFFHYKITPLDENERVCKCYEWIDDFFEFKSDLDLTDGYFKDKQFNMNYEKNKNIIQNKFEKIFQLIGIDTTQSKKLLDIGCGYGHWLQFIRKKGLESYGVTIAPRHVNHCIQNGLNVMKGNSLKVSNYFPQNGFDYVTAIGSMEHFSKYSFTEDEKQNCIRNCLKGFKYITKPGGKIFISLLHYSNNWGNENIFYTGFLVYFIERHYSGYYPYLHNIYDIKNNSLICQIGQELGLKVIHTEDTSEHYRMTSILNKSHFGNCSIHWDWLKLFKIIKYMIIDPYWLHRWIYHGTKCWLRHIGGLDKEPILELKDDRLARKIWIVFEV